MKIVVDDREVLIDDSDFTIIDGKRLPLFGRKNHKYLVVGFGCRSIAFHRLIVKYGRGFFCDHINANTLDNRRENLRICTPTESRQNASKPLRHGIAPRSVFKGVTFCSSRYYWKNPWRARITVNGNRMHLGHFPTDQDAAAAYDAAAKKYFGRFARLNFQN